MFTDLKKILYIFIFTLLGGVVLAQDDSDENRFDFDYTLTPKDVTIADIKVTGASSYEDYVLIGFSGLNKGQEIRVPGADLTNVVKRFWKQGFFSDVKILCDTLRNDSIWLTIALKQLPRVSTINFYGLKKGEVEDIEKTIEVQKGKQLNADAIDRTKIAIRKFLSEKGFHNAEILAKKEEIKDKIAEKNREIETHNAGVQEKDDKYKNSLIRQQTELELQFMQIRNGEFTDSELIDMGYYKDIVDCVKAYYDTLDLETAYNDMVKEQRLVVFLGDYYAHLCFSYRQQYLDYLGIEAFELINSPENEHDALCDARWNLNLYNTIKNKYGIQI